MSILVQNSSVKIISQKLLTAKLIFFIYFILVITYQQCCTQLVNGLCKACPNGMHFYMNNCIFDLPYCLKYSGGFYCTHCQANFTLTDQNQCIKSYFDVGLSQVPTSNFKQLAQSRILRDKNLSIIRQWLKQRPQWKNLPNQQILYVFWEQQLIRNVVVKFYRLIISSKMGYTDLLLYMTPNITNSSSNTIIILSTKNFSKISSTNNNFQFYQISNDPLYSLFQEQIKFSSSFNVAGKSVFNQSEMFDSYKSTNNHTNNYLIYYVNRNVGLIQISFQLEIFNNMPDNQTSNNIPNNETQNGNSNQIYNSTNNSTSNINPNTTNSTSNNSTLGNTTNPQNNTTTTTTNTQNNTTNKPTNNTTINSNTNPSKNSTANSSSGTNSTKPIPSKIDLNQYNQMQIPFSNLNNDQTYKRGVLAIQSSYPNMMLIPIGLFIKQAKNQSLTIQTIFGINLQKNTQTAQQKLTNIKSIYTFLFYIDNKTNTMQFVNFTLNSTTDSSVNITNSTINMTNSAINITNSAINITNSTTNITNSNINTNKSNNNITNSNNNTTNLNENTTNSNINTTNSAANMTNSAANMTNSSTSTNSTPIFIPPIIPTVINRTIIDQNVLNSLNYDFIQNFTTIDSTQYKLNKLYTPIQQFLQQNRSFLFNNTLQKYKFTDIALKILSFSDLQKLTNITLQSNSLDIYSIVRLTYSIENLEPYQVKVMIVQSTNLTPNNSIKYMRIVGQIGQNAIMQSSNTTNSSNSLNITNSTMKQNNPQVIKDQSSVTSLSRLSTQDQKFAKNMIDYLSFIYPNIMSFTKLSSISAVVKNKTSSVFNVSNIKDPIARQMQANNQLSLTYKIYTMVFTGAYKGQNKSFTFIIQSMDNSIDFAQQPSLQVENSFGPQNANLLGVAQDKTATIPSTSLTASTLPILNQNTNNLLQENVTRDNTTFIQRILPNPNQNITISIVNNSQTKKQNSLSNLIALNLIDTTANSSLSQTTTQQLIDLLNYSSIPIKAQNNISNSLSTGILNNTGQNIIIISNQTTATTTTTNESTNPIVNRSLNQTVKPAYIVSVNSSLNSLNLGSGQYNSETQFISIDVFAIELLKYINLIDSSKKFNSSATNTSKINKVYRIQNDPSKSISYNYLIIYQKFNKSLSTQLDIFELQLNVNLKQQNEFVILSLDNTQAQQQYINKINKINKNNKNSIVSDKNSSNLLNNSSINANSPSNPLKMGNLPIDQLNNSYTIDLNKNEPISSKMENTIPLNLNETKSSDHTNNQLRDISLNSIQSRSLKPSQSKQGAIILSGPVNLNQNDPSRLLQTLMNHRQKRFLRSQILRR